MARSACFAPAEPPGEISKIAIGTFANDDEFKENIRTQQQRIHDLYGRDADRVTDMLASTLAIPTGPYPMLAASQSAVGGEAKLIMFHAMRGYILGSLDPPTTDPLLVTNIFAFCGEIHNEDGIFTLPECYLQPEHLSGSLMKQPVKLFTDDVLAQAFVAYDEAAGGGGASGELMASDMAQETERLPKVLAIPPILIPLFVMTTSPRKGLTKMKTVVKHLAEADRHLFDMSL
jgi:hypothetical protein